MTRTLTILTVGAALLWAQARFDLKVRNDFFAGLAGDEAAFDRGMKACEEILATDPKAAEALVWHGVGLFGISGKLFATGGDTTKAMQFYEKGLEEMTRARAIAPENVSVLIPRGATLITATRRIPPAIGAPLLRDGLADFEKVYELQKANFDQRSGHARGELLFGLAEGSVRAGNLEKARIYFERLAAVGPASGHEAEAKEWLATGKIDSNNARCVGCHTSSAKGDNR